MSSANPGTSGPPLAMPPWRTRVKLADLYLASDEQTDGEAAGMQCVYLGLVSRLVSYGACCEGERYTASAPPQPA